MLTPGIGDNSFKLAGGQSGIQQLVQDFYDLMDNLPEAKTIREMHPDNLDISRDKLWRFLCAWLGGPRLYAEKYGPINIPKVHAHLAIGSAERDSWLACMARAIDKQDYDSSFKTYLKEQLAIPAERCRNQD